MTPLPEKVMSLPDSVAAKSLTESMLRGKSSPPRRELDRTATEPAFAEPRPTEILRELVEAAQEYYEKHPTEADEWLAPRLHAALRLTRAEASDSGIWNHIALRVAPDYVQWRHLAAPTTKVPDPKVNRNRFVGPPTSQVFARLWWAAETFRNGPDYRPVEIACRNQDMLNTALRLRVLRHRPTAQAIVRMQEAEGLGRGRQANALVKAINMAASTISFEALAPDKVMDHDAHRNWSEKREDALLPHSRLPVGPEDGNVDEESIKRLIGIFREFYENAPIRGKEKEEEKILT